MDSISIVSEYNHFKQEQIRQKQSKSNKINHKNTVSYNKLKTYLGNTLLGNEQLRTGDRFIPFKNDNNFQNFVLKSPNPDII